MKKRFILFLLSFIILKINAQDLIYYDYEPDIVTEHDDDSIPIDFDEDGLTDVSLVIMSVSTGYQFGLITHGDWQISYITDGDTIQPISEITNWYNQLSWTPSFYIEELCVQKNVGNTYFYGWFRAYNGYISYPHGGFRSYIGLDKYAFCTIPNYPLHWGQTELMDIEETAGVPFATLHPNPTNSLVTIMGESLRQAEVVNMLGQQVLSVQNRGNDLQINMKALPAGVYFITITNEEGRKCVRKVVRE